MIAYVAVYLLGENEDGSEAALWGYEHREVIVGAPEEGGAPEAFADAAGLLLRRAEEAKAAIMEQAAVTVPGVQRLLDEQGGVE